jgi:transcriptional regulator
MYLPPKFREQGHSTLIEIIRKYPFATVITLEDGRPFVSHLPMLVELRKLDEIVLLGHMAKANPQWKHFGEGEVFVIFNGPHAYITPQWYVDSLNVPTWNYAVVHAAGRAQLVDTFEGIENILKKTVTEFERHEPKPWQYDLPEEFRSNLVQGVMGFEIQVTHLEGKLKLSQNRTPEDRAGVLEGLKTRKDEMSLQTLALMESIRTSSP